MRIAGATMTTNDETQRKQFIPRLTSSVAVTPATTGDDNDGRELAVFRPLSGTDEHVTGARANGASRLSSDSRRSRLSTSDFNGTTTLIALPDQLRLGSDSDLARTQLPLPPRAPPPSSSLKKNSRSSTPLVSESRQKRVNDLVSKFVATLGTPGRAGAEETLRRLLVTWTAKTLRHAEGGGSARTPRAGRHRNRPKQRPSLPVEARGLMLVPAAPQAGDGWAAARDPLAVRGSQIDSPGPMRRPSAGAEAAAAMWEKRYNLQVSATEEAFLAKRNTEISLREAERVIEEVRAQTARAARDPSGSRAIATDSPADPGEEGERGGMEGKRAMMRQRSQEARDRKEAELRKRLREAQTQLAEMAQEGATLREALATAKTQQSLQPIITSLGQVLIECLASLGAVRGTSESEFHARVSALRDHAEAAGRGFMSVEGLHTAAEGAKALDSTRALKAQLQEALADAARQRARRAEADGKLMEREAGDRTGSGAGARLKGDLAKARKTADDLRLRLVVTEAELRHVKHTLEEERARYRPAAHVASLNMLRSTSDMVQVAAVRGVFEEGRRHVEHELKLKTMQVKRDLLQMQQTAATTAAGLRENASPQQIPSILGLNEVGLSSST